MVKTTLEIRDDVYRKLVETSLKKYGNTKNLSKVANEVIGKHLDEENDSKKRNVNSGIVEKTFGSWKTEKTGEEYTREIRKGWGKRATRFGI
ncbi:MAG: hypothetical protein HY051_01405 [Candidatus Aenigmarchaeota archaeon]|nr:hypothetical protein [Candidatus Aenigmarchaeota archaeon]